MGRRWNHWTLKMLANLLGSDALPSLTFYWHINDSFRCFKGFLSFAREINFEFHSKVPRKLTVWAQSKLFNTITILSDDLVDTFRKGEGWSWKSIPRSLAYKENTLQGGHIWSLGAKRTLRLHAAWEWLAVAPDTGSSAVSWEGMWRWNRKPVLSHRLDVGYNIMQWFVCITNSFY